VHLRDVPPRVTISEYVTIAHAFFTGKEPGLANGVLDRLARTLRASDL
jgi:N utilization substance protein B